LAHPHAFKEAEEWSSQAAPAHRWSEVQGSLCPELNAQDSNEDVLFQQEMRYPERGVGGFSSLRRAGAGESRNSPPVHLLEELEYQTASKSASERGRRQHREYQEDRSSAGREEVGEGTDHEEPEPAGRKREERSRPASASHHYGSSRPWAGAAAADQQPMPPRISASAALRPEDRRAFCLPGVARACSSRDGVGTTHLPEVTAVPYRGNHGLKRAAGWDLDWGPCRA
jgi:hypothetical protein